METGLSRIAAMVAMRPDEIEVTRTNSMRTNVK